MSNQEFKVWLAVHGYNQNTLAAKLGLSANTISTYVRNERFPIVFIYALEGLALCKH